MQFLQSPACIPDIQKAIPIIFNPTLGMLLHKTLKMRYKLVAYSHHAAPPESNLVQVFFFLCAEDNHLINRQKLRFQAAGCHVKGRAKISGNQGYLFFKRLQ